MLHGPLDGRGVWGRMDTCLCMAESLGRPLETITSLFTGYTPIRNYKFFLKKQALFSEQPIMSRPQFHDPGGERQGSQTIKRHQGPHQAHHASEGPDLSTTGIDMSPKTPGEAGARSPEVPAVKVGAQRRSSPTNKSPRGRACWQPTGLAHRRVLFGQ